ncbi:hypothetical protein ACFOTA_06575 [Chitinophaga sp. GCM10012297]|uniref:Uncharacterized protein n=1 Tax=Chitinophaga chungangae TaxID=2821488 RepID=A0ABS3YB04_9BACT|nr:hypothetical protein [Chitinophaga chungangae]MBO9151865.1 hypothetical protein [Chitinophaga chungangae]
MRKTLEQEVHKYFVQLNKAEQKAVIQLLRTFLKNRQQKPERCTIEQYNRELEEAEKRIAAGDFITHEQLTREMKKW